MNGKEKVEPNSAENIEELNEKVQLESSEESQQGTEEGVDEPKEEVDEAAAELTRLSKELEEAKDKHIRLYSEFENYRRRTAKERLELIKTASEDLLISLIPVVDDFERARASSSDEKDTSTLKEGYDLIFTKFNKILDQKGVKAMDIGQGSKFDAELHEAISQMPAKKNKLKGKIVDVVEKGYTLNEKVIRFAKVVIGT